MSVFGAKHMSADDCRRCCCPLSFPLTPARDPIPYSKAPESAYQAKIRGKASQLQDHICKEMNHVNLHRCRCGWPRHLRRVVLRLPGRVDMALVVRGARSGWMWANKGIS
jgi:hypothetical protein